MSRGTRAILLAGAYLPALAAAAAAQSVPQLTPPTVKVEEHRAGFASKQDYLGSIALLSFGQNGQVPCTGQDDTPAFTAAIAKAADDGGGTVVMPAASCLVSATITLPANVRLVGQGKRSQISPIAAMPAVVTITGGLSSVENVALQANGTLAPAGILVNKPDADVLQTDLVRLSVFGFGKAVRYVSGHTVTVTGGFFLNNGVAFSYEPATHSIVNMVITGGTLVQGGSGIDLPANTSPGNAIYPHVEGLLAENLQVVQGVANGFCMRASAGVHLVWRGGLCGETRGGGYGFQFIASADPLRSVEIGSVFVGANTEAPGNLGGISIGAPVTAMKVHDVHFSSWRGVPLSINAGTGASAQVSIARVSFDNTTAPYDVNVLNADVTITQPLYDVPNGLNVGAGATVAKWPS